MAWMIRVGETTRPPVLPLNKGREGLEKGVS